MSKDRSIGIYKITNIINNKCYIGQSINIERRFEEHKHTKKTSKYLRNAINKYGLNNFTFEILELCERSLLSERERYWIKFYNSTSPNGYNLTQGGEGGNTFQFRTEEEMIETRNKISKAITGKNNGFYGKHHTDETKKVLKEINSGKILSEVTRDKMSKSLHGHYVSEITKHKISQATKRQWQNENYSTLMSEIQKGNKHSLGNTWNKDRIDIYNPITKIHKRIFKNELSAYLNDGFICGVPDKDKRHNPSIRHCTENNLIGVSYNKQNDKWSSYISFNKKRYGNKLFDDINEAIAYRWYLESMITNIINSNNDINSIDVKKSLQENKIVLYN